MSEGVDGHEPDIVTVSGIARSRIAQAYEKQHRVISSVAVVKPISEKTRRECPATRLEKLRPEKGSLLRGFSRFLGCVAGRSRSGCRSGSGFFILLAFANDGDEREISLIHRRAICGKFDI